MLRHGPEATPDVPAPPDSSIPFGPAAPAEAVRGHGAPAQYVAARAQALAGATGRERLLEPRPPTILLPVRQFPDFPFQRSCRPDRRAIPGRDGTGRPGRHRLHIVPSPSTGTLARRSSPDRAVAMGKPPDIRKRAALSDDPFPILSPETGMMSARFSQPWTGDSPQHICRDDQLPVRSPGGRLR